MSNLHPRGRIAAAILFTVVVCTACGRKADLTPKSDPQAAVLAAAVARIDDSIAPKVPTAPDATEPAATGGDGDHRGDEGDDDGVGVDRTASPVDTSEPGFWTETLLVRPFLPKMALAIEPLPDGSAFFVLSRDGDLWLYERPLEEFPLSSRSDVTAINGRPWSGTGTMVRLDDIAARKDIGSIGIGVDPGYFVNHFVYVWSCDAADSTVGLDRYTWSSNPAAVLASRTQIIRFSRREPPKPYHMGGIVEALPDGTLLVGIGDAERQELSQDRQDLNGKFLRILPNRGAEGGYTIPPDNPHVGDPAFRPEIVAVGLRAPFRGFLWRQKHFIFGDVGSTFEEVNVWSGGAADFGWGRHHNADGVLGIDGVVEPIVTWSAQADFSNEDPQFRGETRVAASVGVIYESKQDRYDGRLTDKLIFFDIKRGWVRAGRLTEDFELPTHAHVFHEENVAQMRLGRDGYIYGINYAPPRLWRLRHD